MSGHATKVEQQFGAVAEAYLASTVHSQGADLKSLAMRFHDKNGGRVLDLGCGAGHLSFAIAEYVESVVAYDLSEDMLRTVAREAQQRGLKNISTLQGRAEKLPFDNTSFDSVCTRYSAHHWTELGAALREIRRVLKPGGNLTVIDICAPVDPLFDTHLQAIELLRDGSHVRNYSPIEWRSFLEAAGLAIDVQSTWKLPLGFDAWVTRMKTPPAHVKAIRSLLRNAPREVRDYFQVASDSSFVPDAIMMEAR
jgi:ubiquinone/menaquinone biosynthesis C-methylase UbiE